MTISLKEAFALKEAIAAGETFPPEERTSPLKIKINHKRTQPEELSFENSRYELLDRIKDKAASGILLPRAEGPLKHKITR